MPSGSTFSIAPIFKLVKRYLPKAERWVDPFVGQSIFREACVRTNDLNPLLTATDHGEALEFLAALEPEYADGVLWDPPYSPTQIKRIYNGIGRELQTEDTQSAFFARRKNAVDRLLSPGGIVISCGWNSNGMGDVRGYELLELLLVAHGGSHNDTIVTVEQKAVDNQEKLF